MKMKLDLESNAGTSFAEGYMHLEKLEDTQQQLEYLEV